MIRIAIVQFPGSNCERETMLAIKRADMEPVPFLWNEPRERLQTMDGYVVVGGFSYEDRSRAGIIAALDPVMQAIKEQSEQGKPVLGICNGAQILVETGLVPGLENNKIGMALTENKRIADGKVLGTGFYNAWIHMRLADQYQRNAFTRYLTPKEILTVPVAHGEGRFVMGDALRQEIAVQGQNVFQYCDEHGAIIDCFPINPNGSMDNMAAVSNKAGNVMAMMPHPERTINGDPIFKSMRAYIEEKRAFDAATITPLYYYPRRINPPIYRKPDNQVECIVELMITDNQALTVQQTLTQLGLPVKVRRQVHWALQVHDAEVITRIKQSGVLFNERKEKELTPSAIFPANTNTFSFLVRAKDDVVGLQKQQTLRHHGLSSAAHAIYHGVLWHISSDALSNDELKDAILKTNIILNPYAHDCYQYQQSLS